MNLRACIFTTCAAFAWPAYAQLDSPPPLPAPSKQPVPENKKIEPLVEPGAETRPADQKAASVKFEVESGLDLGTDKNGRVIVESVKPKQDAANAGVKENDVLIAIDDVEINSAVSLADFLEEKQDVRAHILKFRRGDKEFEVTLGKKVDLLGMLIIGDESDRPLIRRVEKGSPADRAGIRRGDLISGISGREVESINQFSEFAIPLVRKMSEGQEIPLRLVREGDNIDVNVIRPEDAALPLIPAPKEEVPTRPQVIKERTIERHHTAAAPVDDDAGYVGGLSGFQADGGGSGLALDFSNTGPLTPIGEASAVSATLHHVGTIVRERFVGGRDAGGNDGGDNFSGGGHGGTAGFVLVQANGRQAIVNARLAGFASGRYRLAVYEFGDCGDVANGSAGQGVLELGTFIVDRRGRGFLQTAVNNVSPQALLGRVVAVTPVGRVNAEPANPTQPLDQNIRRGNPRTRPRTTPNPNDGQALREAPGQFFMNLDPAQPVLLAQAPKAPPKAAPQTPAAGGQKGIAPGERELQEQQRARMNQNRRGTGANELQDPATTGDVDTNAVDPNLDNRGTRERTTFRSARQACGVFGLANAQRPIIPLDPSFNPLEEGAGAEGAQGVPDNNLDNADPKVVPGTRNNGTGNRTGNAGTGTRGGTPTTGPRGVPVEQTPGGTKVPGGIGNSAIDRINKGKQ